MNDIILHDSHKGIYDISKCLRCEPRYMTIWGKPKKKDLLDCRNNAIKNRPQLMSNFIIIF